MVRPRFEKDAQLTIGGATMSEEEWAQALQSIPNIETRCPFCLAKQNLRSMVFALPDGVMSKRRRCRACKKEMQAESAVVFLKGEADFGRWVASYPRFWQVVNHDKFMEAIQSMKELGLFKPWEFWDAYRELRPKKQLDQQGYAKPQQEQPKGAFEDEWEATKKRHTRPDGSIDWDAISAETETKVENDFAPEYKPPEKHAYMFRNTGGQGLPDQTVYGDELKEDEKSYTVVDGTSRQRFLKEGWALQ